MTSYFRSWWTGIPTTEPEANPEQSQKPIQIEIGIVPPPQEEEEEDDGYDTDRPPAFPALNSIQRASNNSTTTKTTQPTRNGGLMLPPPVPGRSLSSGLGSSLALPQTTTKPPKKSRKVVLAPGHSTLDWAALKESGKDLRGGVTGLLRVTPEILKQHNKPADAWTVINGKVYDVTAYIPYHPGGEKELMRVAGRDGTKLFALTHAWVSAEVMLDSCMVGLYVPS